MSSFRLLLFFCPFVFSGIVIPQKKQTEAIANIYPYDIGIEQDPDVIYVEKFEGGLDSIFRRYTDIKNSGGMSLSDIDVPAGSRSHSIKLTSIGGINDGGHLFRQFRKGFDSTIFIRYYVKYPSVSKGYIHHESVWIGGYNESLAYPHPRAGSCALGESRLSIAYEPTKDSAMDTYLYWGEMKSWNGGSSCYGNDMVNGSPTSRKVPWDAWTCVEIMIKLNNPVSSNNGELRVWQDGVEVGYWKPGLPKGYWQADSWINNSSGKPFDGFIWRTNPALIINYLWIEYFDDKSEANAEHYIQFSNLIMARKYIGPISQQ